MIVSDAAFHDSPTYGDRSYWGHSSGEWFVLRSYPGSYIVSYPDCHHVYCSEFVHSCARPTPLLCLCRWPYWQVEKRIGEARKPGPPGDIDDPNAAYDIDEHDGDGIGIGHGAVSQPDVGLGVIVNEAFTRSLGQRCFVHSVAFKGARPGAVFKMGEQGLGYYRDTRGSDCAAAAQTAAAGGKLKAQPVVITLADLLCLDVEGAVPVRTRQRRLRVRSRVQGRRAMKAPWDGPHDETLAACSRFRGAALWAFDTFNPNCGNKALD